jgi:Beta-lactamase
VPGIGLAFFRANVGGHLAVEHHGILPGFNSQIWVAPDDGVGVMAFTNGAKQAMLWLPAEVSGLLKRLLGVPDEVIRTDVPHRPEIWGDICGLVRVSTQMTDRQARAMAGLGVEVFVRRGQLMLRALSPIRALYRGFLLHPDDEKDPYVFRIDLSEFGIGTARVVFSRDPGVRATSIHLDLVPLSLHRQAAAKNPRRWATGALGALGVATTAIAVRGRRTEHEIIEGAPRRG